MRINETAAAYGLFQVIFADVADHLAIATFHLRKQKEPDLTFQTVFKQEFKRTLKQFRRELWQFEGRPAVFDSLYALRRRRSYLPRMAYPSG